MVLNTQTPHPIYNQQPRTTMQDTSKIRKKTQHAHNQKRKKEFKPAMSKLLLFSFLLQNKTKTTKRRSSHGKKNKGSLKANF
jgi:hypothetical protein